MKRVASSDRQALRLLYDRYGGQALSMAQAMLRNQGEAEEIVQDVFLEAWKRAAEYDPRRGSVRGWLLVLVRSRSIDRLRTHEVAARLTQLNPFHPAVRSAEVATPLELVEQKQARERVRLALEQLPAEQRRVVSLGYFDGLSQSEIANVTGDPLGTVKTRVRLAMAKLSELLGIGAKGEGP
jgi:RNA polymerase sigma-70 factor (ECF subfamily)